MVLHPPVDAVLSAEGLDAETEADADADADNYPRLQEAVPANVSVSGESTGASLQPVPWPRESTESAIAFSSVLPRLPRSVGQFMWLTTLRLFAAESCILLSGDVNPRGVEGTRDKVPLLRLSGNDVEEATDLTGTQLCKAPKLFDVTFQSLVAAMRSLTKLAACHLSIRILPPEICYLKKLEELDLSFNYLNSLPDTISGLTELRSLRVAYNKLLDLPSGLSDLRMLEVLDVSNNKLTSLESLELTSMGSLQYLNIQNNKLLNCYWVPLWVCCNMEKNGVNAFGNGCYVSVEDGIGNNDVQKIHGCGHHPHSSNSLVKHSSRCSLSQKPIKGWKGHDSLQEKARQERLNYSRNCKIELLSQCTENVGKNKFCKVLNLENEDSEFQLSNCRKQSVCLSDFDSYTTEVLADRSNTDSDHGEVCINGSSSSVHCLMNGSSSKQSNASDNTDSISCITSESVVAYEDGSFLDEVDSSNSSPCHAIAPGRPNGSLFNMVKFNPNPKRRYSEDLHNPKPSKYARSIGECSSISYKYCTESLCGVEDRLPDGFYDAGRDRPFMPLHSYDEGTSVDSREIILLDRESDEELDAILLSAQLLLSRFNKFNHANDHNSINDFQRASVLALFVSDCFGGSDRSLQVAQMRKAVSGSNKPQPFVCTCSATRSYCNSAIYQNFNFNDLCEQSLRLIKESRSSNVVPIGKLRFGVCRHRAVLMKYLCDRMDPPIPCELVRGYLDYMPHAWNAISVKQENTWTRMVVDTCYPTDIREDTDPEYFCRYIPLSRVLFPFLVDGFREHGCPLPSFPLYFGPGELLHRYVKHCKLGSLDIAAKVKNLSLTVPEKDVKLFEYGFLGEVRMLGSLRHHSCIVEMYGHRISSKWGSSTSHSKETCGSQSVIFMEYVKGGSLKGYLEKLANAGGKHVPADLAINVARDIASALVEVHSKQIIHRDIKSENVLIDFESKRADGSLVVKLSDFDNAVPLQSFLHTCCIRHYGVHLPCFCVGTPRWMAPEVFLAMNQRSFYGLEADIWSYGCLIYELLTLQIPYEGLPDCEIYDLLQRKQRPRLTLEVEELVLSNSDADTEKFKILVELFYWCTNGSPAERPVAKQIYDMICDVSPPIHSLL